MSRESTSSLPSSEQTLATGIEFALHALQKEPCQMAIPDETKLDCLWRIGRGAVNKTVVKLWRLIGQEASVGLEISIREISDIKVLDLRGRSTLNGGEAETLRKCLKDLVATGAGKVLLNMAELKQIDSSGISAVIDTYVCLRDRGGELKLLSPRGSVLEVLRVLRLLDIIPSFSEETQAVASFRLRSYAACW